jgi:predicted ATPase/DNA-binding SARP family transcriptional activator
VIEFRILGPLEVRADGRVVEVGGAKPRAVLAVLLLHADEPVSADRLAHAVWGEEASAGAVKTLQVHVSRLRRTLGERLLPTSTAAGYRLRIEPEALDANRFDRTVAAGRDALAAGRAAAAADLLREALALWRGDPLAEFAWAPFAPAERDRLEELRMAALELRIEADLAAGRHAELVAELQQLARRHPWRERLHAHLMVALYRSGRQADALAAYRDARAALVQHLGIEPGPELHDLHQALLAHDASLQPPPVRATRPAGRRSALPAPPNRTIGRAAEVEAIVERLRVGPARLLTLTGPGGVGKTRLALEVARAVEPDFPDGAHLVALDAVERADDVPAAIVASLGIVPVRGESTEQAVERFLAAKQLLLVVDNCEHLPNAAPFIGAIPAGSPGVTVLATSREPLDVQAEHRHPVAPLAVPERGGLAAKEAEGDAVALFRERARAHDPGFELDEDNVGDVAEICRRVDGLPLAIELAAARCSLLSPGEIAERLQSALDTPGAGARDAPARRQTLRATIDWSHTLLAEDERRCFARFAVFAGGATVDAAEAVTGANLDVLDRLVGKSLLMRPARPLRPTRLTMLETVRAYAAERFAASADGPAVRERHRRHFLAFAEHHGTDRALWGARRREHLARLDADEANFHVALAWAAEQEEARPALELCVALGWYWLARDRNASLVDWVDRALEKPGADRAPALCARALCLKAWALWPLGRGGEELVVLGRAEEIARMLRDPALLSHVLEIRATQESWNGRLDTADALAEEALAQAQAAGDEWAIAMASRARAMASGDVAMLRERVDRAVSQLNDVGNAYHVTDLLVSATQAALRHGSDDDLRAFAERALPEARELGSPFLSMFLGARLGLGAVLHGDVDIARAAFRETLELCRRLVVRPVAFEGLAGLAAVAAVGDDLDRAARLAGAAAAYCYDEPQRLVAARLDATILRRARERRGPDDWDAAVADGKRLGFADAIAYALDEAGPTNRATSADAV